MKKENGTMKPSEVQPIEDESLEQVDGGFSRRSRKKGSSARKRKTAVNDLVYHPGKDKAEVTKLPSTSEDMEILKLSGGPFQNDPTDDKTSFI